MTNATEKLVYRVFQAPTGFFFCNDAKEYLDTRGQCYPDRKTATAAAIESGLQREKYEGAEFSGLVGYGVCRRTARLWGCPVLD